MLRAVDDSRGERKGTPFLLEFDGYSFARVGMDLILTATTLALRASRPDCGASLRWAAEGGCPYADIGVSSMRRFRPRLVR